MDGQDKQDDVLEYSMTIGLVAMEGRGFEYPTDLVAARDGRLYVPNRARDLGERGVRVTVTDIDSEYYGTFAHHGQGDGYMISPMCIAEDTHGRLYVTDDYTNRVSVFDYDGNFILAWGERGDGEGQFNGPSGIAVDAEDDISTSPIRTTTAYRSSQAAAGSSLSSVRAAAERASSACPGA